MFEKLEATSAEAQSSNPVADNIAKLKALFPELLTEGVDGAAINVDVLKALFGDRTASDVEEKYGLNWHGKRRARQLALTPSTGTLRPSREESVDWDTTQNLMIEGDNLEVLKLLQKSYAGKVKLIYIDPPYNTGKDFVYPDNFQDNIKNYLQLTGQIEGGAKISSNTEASGRFHTDWLNMMYPRLKLAWNLLREDGFIFISIDENEIGNLRVACDEIFGEENFKGQITRPTGTPTGQGTERLVNELDYIVVYSRSNETGFAGQSLSEDGEKIYDQQDDRGRFLTRPLRKTGGEDRRVDRPSMFYPVEAPDGTNVYPIGPSGYESRWRCGFETYKDHLSNGLILWKEVKGENAGTLEWKPYQKFYLEGRMKQPGNLWSNLEGNKKASREVRDLFNGQKVFDFPKPVDLIRNICEISTDKTGVVLDFFAGSGTTGHAVMAQSAIDGGNRRYILVQLPEPLDPDNKDQASAADFCDQLGKPRTIAELTKERLRRAAAKVKADNPMFGGDTGFRVFKLDTSNIRAWSPNRENIEQSLLDHQEHVDAGRTETDVLYELLLKLGLDLCVPIEQQTIARKTVNSVGGGVLITCLDTSITAADAEPLALGIVAWHQQQAPAGETVCVFRDSAFADDVAKSNLAAILEQHGIAKVRSL
ncbi:DNA methyltransferase (plasmid) [Paraburkholderia phytofirmans OLGA172]|uniref:site-specific DNA-methyltransferase (adenine-specific) n=1 Tax=Paraburkholderia phytofirmans OLGA172 TaxID=1417228 RepID=A0A161I0R0_9BURK|nr:site-specific DNA-methyltransferase [Paraburkholderia phytofirmans]ANB78081.1 DNA methyltransferase [Paraburkholderia phytofirmans OLGA172]